jgi:hypothetical protein
MAGRYVAHTPLTTRQQRSAQAAVKARKAAARGPATSNAPRQRPSQREGRAAAWTCPDCGGPVANQRHVRCDACIAADPRQTDEIRGRRGAAIAARKRAFREWEQANPVGIAYDRDYFRQELLAKLSRVKLADIAKTAGCSKAYASDIRSGKYAPHVSTWAALAGLVANLPITPLRD